MVLLMTRETMRSAEIGPKTGPKHRRRAASATPPDASKPASELGSRSGASRTRTGDLLGAIQGAQRLNMASLQGDLGSSRQDDVPKIARNLRKFTRVLARGGARVAKPPDGYQDRRTRQGQETRAILRERHRRPTLPLACGTQRSRETVSAAAGARPLRQRGPRAPSSLLTGGSSGRAIRVTVRP
jgi:hypothetical protein